MDIVKQLRMYPYEYTRNAADEIERLRERCNPSKVVMIGDTGHYVSEAVAAEIERLRDKVGRRPEIERIADALCEYNESDSQDAARYRWLRDVAEATDWEMFGYQDRGRRDAAIDDAMGRHGAEEWNLS